MRQKCAGEGMVAFICRGIGLIGAFQYRQGKDASLGTVTVFTIIQKGKAIAVFRDIHPFLSADLKLGLLPARVLVRGAGDVAKLNFIGGLICMQVAGEEELQDLMLFVPIDLMRKLDARRIGIEPKRLADLRISIRMLDCKACARAIAHGGDLCLGIKNVGLLGRVGCQLPGVVKQGIILVGAEFIHARSGGHKLARRALIVKRGNAACAINLYAVKIIFRVSLTNTNAGALFLGADHRIAEGGDFPFGRVGFAVYRDLAAAGKAERIINENAALGVDARGKRGELFVFHGIGIAENPRVVLLRVFVNRMHARSGENVVELVMERIAPGEIHPCLIVRAAEIKIRGGKCLGRAERKLGLSVAALRCGLGGVSASVIFKIQFAYPTRRAAELLHVFGKLRGERLGIVRKQREAQNRHSGEALGKAVGVFEHFARRAAATVTVSVGIQGNVCIFLLRKSLPCASDIGGNIFSDVGGLAVLRSVFHKRPRGDEGGKNFASVNSLPKEGIHGKRIRIVPADL